MTGSVFGRTLLSLALAIGSACSGPDPETPEARIRARIAELEAAAETGDVQAFKDHVSTRYEDGYGHDKEALGRYVALHVMRNQSRHVVLRVRDVLVVSPDQAEVVIIAGIGGTRRTAEDASTFHGNVYQIDADLEEEDGEWRLVWAQWKPTAPAELL